MGIWRALSDGMRIARKHRPRRIGAREAEALLTGKPTRSDRRELAQLLSAAAGATQPHELAGEDAVLAMFAHASRQPPADKAGRTGPTLVRALTRAVVVKLVAGAATLLVGGAALAAETGHLPEAAQQRAHEIFSALGVPPPQRAHNGKTGTPPNRPDGQPGATGATPDQHDDPGHGTHGNSGGGSTGSGREDAELVRLCRDYRKQQRKPDSKRLTPDELRKLESAAGGAANVTGYCDKLLGNDDGAPPTHQSQPSPGPSPSRDKKHGKGGQPAFPSQDRQPHPNLF
jgi:hypothetical protein